MINEINANRGHWEQFNRHVSVLESNCTHIFSIDTEIYFKEIQSVYPNILSTKELLKANRFKQLQDGKNYISRKYYLRLLLSKVLSIDPSKIDYGQIGNKKPYLKGIEFNTTHSGNMAFVALSRFPVGIDSEFIKKDFDFDALLVHCFNVEELRYIKSGDMKSNFYSLWTRKEAILKATAEGLIDDLKQVDCLPDLISRSGHEFYIHTLAVNESHILSIACDSPLERIKFWA